MFVPFEFGIEDGHQRSKGILIRCIGTFFKDVEIRYDVIALAVLYIGVVDIVPLVIERAHVGIGYPWVVNRVCEAFVVGQIRPLFATVSEYGGSHFQFAIDTVVGFQRQVEAVVFYAFHIALFHIVA